ncbi:MAG: hypothetical protein V1800_00155 [Candidatus Latescibacterota bacterium]
MADVRKFPFGQSVRELAQEDRTLKQVFVLGVYASAVHARWVGNGGKEIVKALAVASEPEIFWRGENAAAIIHAVSIQRELGCLVAADHHYNGPSGRALDEHFLSPLGLTREDAWLCDLVPHSCMNPGQKKAVERAYQPLVCEYGLPEVSVPRVPTSFSDEERRGAILGEILESQAEILVLLGDQPIRWFLRFYAPKWQRLSDFGADEESYGSLHSVSMAGRERWVLPLAHPRQVDKLGHSSARWHRLHRAWEKGRAKHLLGSSGGA